MIEWDENDYSRLATQPYQNNVVLTVETNSDGQAGMQGGVYYNSFSCLPLARSRIQAAAPESRRATRASP